MNKKIFFALLISFTVLLYINPVKLQKGGEREKITVKEKIDNDYLFSGNELEFSGEASNLYFIGKSLDFSGTVKSSIIGLGKSILINGKTQNNVLTGARHVEVNGNINGNTFIIGREISIGKNAVNNGAVFAIGRNITIEGKINGDLYIIAANLINEGEINGNVKTTAGKIWLSNSSKINGNLTYRSDHELTNVEKSKVAGTIQYSKLHDFAFKGKSEYHKGIKFFMVFINVFILITFLIGGLLLLLFPVFKNLENIKENKNTLLYALWGLIPFLVYPASIVLLCILGITFPLAIILFSAGLPVIFFTQLIGITIFGKLMFKVFKWKNTNRLLFFLFGMAFYAVLRFIPFLAFLSIIFFSSLGWGLILEGLFKKKLA